MHNFERRVNWWELEKWHKSKRLLLLFSCISFWVVKGLFINYGLSWNILLLIITKLMNNPRLYKFLWIPHSLFCALFNVISRIITNTHQLIRHPVNTIIDTVVVSLSILSLPISIITSAITQAILVKFSIDFIFFFFYLLKAKSNYKISLCGA